MFLENHKPGTARRGWIEVICGSMFSGKTEELIRRLKRAKIANQNVKVFKPQIDNRYHHEKVVSHNYNATLSTPVKSSNEILDLARGCDVAAIDEAQFFDAGLIEVCNKLADSGVRVIIAGLDMDFQGKPFGPMPQLMACAEYVTKVHAICVDCGNLAHISHRKTEDQALVVVGEMESYEPLCRDCYNKASRGTATN